MSRRTKPLVAPYVARPGLPLMLADEAVLNSREPGVFFSKPSAASYTQQQKVRRRSRSGVTNNKWTSERECYRTRAVENPHAVDLDLSSVLRMGQVAESPTDGNPSMQQEPQDRANR